MLATACGKQTESPGISGLKIWQPRSGDRLVPMRRTKNGQENGGVKGKAIVYTNLVRNPYQAAHNILFSYGRMADSGYMSSAIYEFTEDDWGFLEMASGELARLSRMSDLLPGFSNMIRNPCDITNHFCGLYGAYPSALYGSVNRDLTDSELRYRLSMYVSLGGAIFSIFTYGHDSPLARALCAVLFSRPYRQDWLDCPLREIEDDVEYLANLFRKHSQDFSYDAWNHEMAGAYRGGYSCKLSDLILNCQVLRQMVRKRESSDLPVYVEPKPRLSFAGIPSWFSDKVDIHEAQRDISPLPPTAMALKVNPVSGAVVPMYPALDECDLPVALVPESKAVWGAMIKIYGMKRHDALYPESPSTQILLSPQDAYFAQELTDSYNLIYLGLQSLGQYVEEIGKLEENGANPDYQFHAFAIEQESGMRRRRH